MKAVEMSIADAVARVRTAREAIRDDIELLLDANCAYRASEAIQFAEQVEEFRPLLVRGASTTRRL